MGGYPVFIVREYFDRNSCRDPIVVAIRYVQINLWWILWFSKKNYPPTTPQGTPSRHFWSHRKYIFCQRKCVFCKKKHVLGCVRQLCTFVSFLVHFWDSYHTVKEILNIWYRSPKKKNVFSTQKIEKSSHSSSIATSRSSSTVSSCFSVCLLHPFFFLIHLIEFREKSILRTPILSKIGSGIDADRFYADPSSI